MVEEFAKTFKFQLPDFLYARVAAIHKPIHSKPDHLLIGGLGKTLEGTEKVMLPRCHAQIRCMQPYSSFCNLPYHLSPSTSDE